MPADDGVAAVRDFNRFYTRHIGVLHEGLLRSDISLTEARLLYEIAHRDGPSAAELAADLGLDPGYVSRLLAGFGRRGLVERRRADSDGRRQHLALTRRGRSTFAALDALADDEVRAELAPLSDGARRDLVRSMRAIRAVLEPAARPAAPYVLRAHVPGDIGWVVSRHGALYAAEQGWDERFEALVARIAADFVDHFDPARERCWIAERDGERVGSVFLVERSPKIAQLRLLLVEPSARGLGLGKRLVDECTRFARQARYRRIRLWTNGILKPAIHVYQRAGYRLIAEDGSEEFGNQTWELVL